ncbi:SSI family serine proteinase inhibitor [Nocardiopsis halotolerans]|uniref:SSI family serine proteinase inhibitor n=1 Tax=Nocardiopsis halotolerans TaxID=124252 RepID=UPI00036E9DB3|nr:SSI family serine proteinase inhibitor [Nocardiopsis halotolerans]
MAQNTLATALPVRLAALAALGLLITACGNEPAEVSAPAPESASDETPSPSESESGEDTSSPPEGSSEEASPEEPSEGDEGTNADTRLTIERSLSGDEALEPAEGYETGTWTLTCAPAGGDHPDPEAACAEIEEVGVNPFVRDDTSDMMCTMQVGGPEVVHVTGHIGETEVDTEFNKRDGCEIDRFETVSTVIAP